MEPLAKFAHKPVLLNSLPGIYQSECHVDVTFVCNNGIKVKAHKLLLGSVSPFLHHIFRSQSPREMIEILLPEVKADDLDNLLRYTYEGLIRLDQYEVKEFKKLKKMLQINIPTIISEIPEDENECEREDEELNDVYTVSETTLADLSISASPCLCEGFKQVSSEEKSQRAHGLKRLNPFNSSFTSNLKKRKVESTETRAQSSVPQNLNCLLRSFASNLGTGTTEADASMPNKQNSSEEEVNDSHSVQGVTKCPRSVPLELYRDFVHKVLREKTTEEAKIFVKEEIARRLEEEVEKKLVERLAKEGKLILVKDLRAMREIEKQKFELGKNVEQITMCEASGVTKPNSKCQGTESLETTIPNSLKEKQSNKVVTVAEEECKRNEENGPKSKVITEKRSVIVRQIRDNEKMTEYAPILQTLPLNHSKDQEVHDNPGKKREMSSGEEKGKNRVTATARPQSPQRRGLLNAPQSSLSSGSQSSNISHVPMPKPVGIKVIGSYANTIHPGKTIAVTSDGKVLFLKVTKNNEQQYSLAPRPGILHDQVTEAISVPLSTSLSTQLSKTATTQKVMTAEEKIKASSKEQENK